MAKALLRNHAKLTTTDYDEAHAFVALVWEKHKSTFRANPYGLTWNQAELGSSFLAYVHTEAPERSVCEGALHDVYRVSFHYGGRIDHRINGKPATSTPSQGFIYGPGQHLQVESEPFRLLSLTTPGRLVRKALSGRFASLPALETWATELPLGQPAAEALASLCRWTAAELDRPESILLHSPRSRTHLDRTLLSLLVECLAERHPDAGQRTADLAEARVRLVEDWIDAHLTEPLGVEDLAAVADVSVRSLQLTFRRLRGCSPMQALMRRRLAFARRLLEHAGPSANVTSVAMDLGFFNLGRFAVRYRQEFGEPPSVTLARQRRRAD